MKHAFFASLTALAVASVSLPGCRIGSGSFCNQVCDCTGCSEGEEEDCIDDFEDGAKLAEGEGCSDQFDDLVSCSADELECSDGVASFDGCEVEAEALSDCTDAPISVGGTSCEAANRRIVARFEACGLDVGETNESEQPECTAQVAEQTACFEGCVEAATCNQIVESMGPWIDCITSC